MFHGYVRLPEGCWPLVGLNSPRLVAQPSEPKGDTGWM